MRKFPRPFFISFALTIKETKSPCLRLSSIGSYSLVEPPSHAACSSHHQRVVYHQPVSQCQPASITVSLHQTINLRHTVSLSHTDSPRFIIWLHLLSSKRKEQKVMKVKMEKAFELPNWEESIRESISKQYNSPKTKYVNFGGDIRSYDGCQSEKVDLLVTLANTSSSRQKSNVSFHQSILQTALIEGSKRCSEKWSCTSVYLPIL